MKLRRKIALSLVALLLAGLLSLCVFSQAPTNVWLLLTENAYFVPKESSIWSFEATVLNQGSGNWWVCGEDSRYFYVMRADSGYFFMAKNENRQNPCPWKTE
jgi:hypothetical protein